MSDNLLALQRSARAIRNPFGFIFKCHWDKVDVELPGDGQWRTFIGPLADHIARRLFQAVCYALHDKEVARLRESGQEKLARKYQLPGHIKNKVFLAITGTDHPDFKNGDIDLSMREEMDFSILDKDMKDFDRKAAQAEETISVSRVVEQASNEAIAALAGNSNAMRKGSDNSGSIQGGINLGAAPVRENLPTQPIDPGPLNAANEVPAPQAPAPAPDSGFVGLKELT